jgi:lysophospholipase L1-like esterase
LILTKRALFRVFLVASSLAATVGALEVAFRLFDIRPRFDHARYVETGACLELEPHPYGPGGGRTPLSRSLFRYRPDCTWATRYPSNPRGYFDELNQITYEMNSEGFRDRDFGPRNPMVCRIVSMGDSLTMGEGVRLEHTYAKVLEEELRRSGRVLEVFNLGVSGYDTRDEVAVLNSNLARYRPDVVILGFYLNDISRQAFDDWVSSTMQKRKKTVRETRFRVVNLARETVWGWQFSRSYVEFMADLYDDQENWTRLVTHLKYIVRRVEAHGAAFLVVVFPDLNLVGRRTYAFASIHSRLAEFFSGEGIEYIDLCDVFDHHGPARLKVHPVDAHPNEIAHRLVGESLVEWFIDRSGLDDRCSRGRGSEGT